jgi:hypothetical protein
MITIKFSCTGYREQSIFETFTNGEGRSKDFFLYPDNAKATVHGKFIYSKAISPLANVTITVVYSGQTTQTDIKGEFIFHNILFGSQQFEFEKKNTVNATYTFIIETDPFFMEIIEPIIPYHYYPKEIHTKVSGQITDSLTGKPIANARIYFPGTNLNNILTDTFGNYDMTLPQGKYNLIGMAIRYEAVKLTDISVIPGKTKKLDFNLPPATKGVLKGFVYDHQTKQPIYLASIQLANSHSVGGSSEVDGSYVVVGVPEGIINIEVLHPEYQNHLIKNVTITDLKETILDIYLIKTISKGIMEGYIRDLNSKKPIANAKIFVEDSKETTITNNNGYYSLKNLPAGLIDISISASGYPKYTNSLAVVINDAKGNPKINMQDFALSMNGKKDLVVSKIIISKEGGTITAPNHRFTITIPKDGLSADALFTIIVSSLELEIIPGQKLEIEENLNIPEIIAIGTPIKLTIEPVQSGSPIPEILKWIQISGFYYEKEIHDFNIVEENVLPFYYNGKKWELLQMKLNEMINEPINNLNTVSLNLKKTECGKAINNKVFYFNLGGVAE